MTIAEWCVFGAVMLYLLTLAPAKASGRREFDNGRPRDPAFYADPRRQRILGAHNNGLEAFPFFAAAVLLAEFRAAPQATIDLLAIGFLVTRVAFVFAYVGDKPTLRSLLWTVAFFFNIAIFFLPALGPQGALITLAAGAGWALVLVLIMAAIARRNAAGA